MFSFKKKIKKFKNINVIVLIFVCFLTSCGLFPSSKEKLFDYVDGTFTSIKDSGLPIPWNYVLAGGAALILGTAGFVYLRYKSNSEVFTTLGGRMNIPLVGKLNLNKNDAIIIINTVPDFVMTAKSGSVYEVQISLQAQALGNINPKSFSFSSTSPAEKA